MGVGRGGGTTVIVADCGGGGGAAEAGGCCGFCGATGAMGGVGGDGGATSATSATRCIFCAAGGDLIGVAASLHCASISLNSSRLVRCGRRGDAAMAALSRRLLAATAGCGLASHSCGRQREAGAGEAGGSGASGRFSSASSRTAA